MTDVLPFRPEPVTRLQRVDIALTTEVGGELVMMDPDKGLYFGLDPIGTDIWHRLATAVVVADLVADLARDYQASPAEVERDVLDLLSRMAEHGLVAECPS